MKNWSIRSRLIIGTLVISVCLLMVAGVSFFLAIRFIAIKEFDQTLVAKAHGLAASFELEGDNVELEGRLPGEFFSGKNAEYFQLWANDRSLFRSPSLRKNNRHLEHLPGVRGKTYLNEVLPDGRKGRFVYVPFSPPDWRQPDEDETDDDHDDDESFMGGESGIAMVLCVARSTEQLDSMIAMTARWLIGLGVAIILVLVCLLWWFINRSLRPLNELGRQIETIAEPKTQLAISIPDAPVEVAPVVNIVNKLLDRLGSAFEAEKSLSAEIAHDLRTPLSGLKMNLQLANSQERTNGEYKQFVANCSQICDGMQAMVESRMALARLDSGQIKAEFEPLILDLLLHECWRPFSQHAEERHLVVDWNLAQNLELVTDANLLKIVFQNLFQNIVSYANDRGVVRIETKQTVEGIAISISNSGCSIREKDLSRIFDRYWRQSIDGESTSQHSGLGLPIARLITELIGANIAAKLVPEKSFEIRIEFPKTNSGFSNSGANRSAAKEVMEARLGDSVAKMPST